MLSESEQYQRIAQVIHHLRENFTKQPELHELAQSLDLSPFYLQKLFSEWAGVSPKKFLQFLTIDYAKNQLRQRNSSLFDVSFDVGFSSTSRLHDLFVSIEGMTPAEYKNKGKGLSISYAVASGFLGQFLVASTQKGICFLHFGESEAELRELLFSCFPEAAFTKQNGKFIPEAIALLNGLELSTKRIHLHLKGSTFQLKVWEALLTIPKGNLKSYGQIASQIGMDSASRAVGTAIGSNPVALLIPCHRVIRESGQLGGYRWGLDRKQALLVREALQTNQSENL